MAGPGHRRPVRRRRRCGRSSPRAQPRGAARRTPGSGQPRVGVDPVSDGHATGDPAADAVATAGLRPSRRPPPAPRPRTADMSRIITVHPRTYNEARTIGEHFRDGVPVIMNLSEMEDVDAKRLVDFAAGLIFGLRGTIERVTSKVFLLSPQNVTVAAEDKERIARRLLQPELSCVRRDGRWFGTYAGARLRLGREKLVDSIVYHRGTAHRLGPVDLPAGPVRPDDPVLGAGAGPRLGAAGPDAGGRRDHLLDHRSAAAAAAQGAASRSGSAT